MLLIKEVIRLRLSGIKLVLFNQIRLAFKIFFISNLLNLGTNKVKWYYLVGLSNILLIGKFD